MVKKSPFPLFRDDKKTVVHLTPQQYKNVESLNDTIQTKKLQLIENHCLCHNLHEEKDIVVSEKDRYGLPIPQILCSKCGLIRSGMVFDENSNIEFYKTYYRPIYSQEQANDSFFYAQIKRGKKFKSLISQYVDIHKIDTVAEIGCGAGGILMPFYQAGKAVIGCDYGEEYLSYGRNKGLNLLQGDVDVIADESQDLIILSHVMEHFLHPIEELSNIIKKVKNEKYLLIEVPGIFYISEGYFNPILYFQNAHVYNYYYYLQKFFETLGLTVLYGDERCTFILQKPSNWQKPSSNCAVFDKGMTAYVEKISDYLQQCKADYEHKWQNPKFVKFTIKHKMLQIANMFGWQKIRRIIIKS